MQVDIPELELGNQIIAALKKDKQVLDYVVELERFQSDALDRAVLATFAELESVHDLSLQEPALFLARLSHRMFEFDSVKGVDELDREIVTWWFNGDGKSEFPPDMSAQHRIMGTGILVQLLLILHVDRRIDRDDVVLKEITFPPGAVQAGIGIFHYFSEILKSKIPNSNVSLSVRQIGDTVSLHVLSAEGDELEIIEKSFKDYMMVVAGKEPLETVARTELEIVRLQGQLEIAQVRIRQDTRALRYMEDQLRAKDDRIKSLEDMQTFLLEAQNNASERSDRLLEKIIETAGIRESEAAVEILKILAGQLDATREDVVNKTKELATRSPSVAKLLYENLLKAPINSASGTALYEHLPFILVVLSSTLKFQ